MDREEYDILAGMIGIMGQSTAAEILKRLVEGQALAFKRGHTLISQLVAAGEHVLFVDGYVQNAVQLKRRESTRGPGFHQSDDRQATLSPGHCRKGSPSACGGSADRFLSLQRSAGDSGAQARLLDGTQGCPVAAGIAGATPHCAAAGMGSEV